MCGGVVLEPLASYLDSFLQPAVFKLQQCLRDTKHFIQVYEGLKISENAILVFLDISALYTSIPHCDIKSVVFTTLDSRQDQIPPTHFLMDQLDLILDKNYFRFGDQFFYQIKGVAMGSAVAPSVANLFMGLLGKEFILNADNNPFMSHIKHYYRYIDDLILVYEDPDSLVAFMTWLNSRHDYHFLLTVPS